MSHLEDNASDTAPINHNNGIINRCTPPLPRPRVGTSQSTRPGTRTLDVTSGPHLISQVTRVDLSPEDLIAEEVADWIEGLEADRSRGGLGDPALEEHRCVWEGTRLLAVLRPCPNGLDEPDVIRLDPQTRLVPFVSTPVEQLSEDERFLLRLIRSGTFREAFERLTLSGRYAKLGEALGWWGEGASSQATGGAQ